MKNNNNSNKKNNNRPKQPKPNRQPSAFTNQRNNGPAASSGLSQQMMRTEVGQQILGDVIGNSSYCQSFNLDTLGFVDTKLEILLRMYEKWFVRKLSFEFVPTVPKTQAGTIHITPEYDPLDTAPTTDIPQQLSQSYHYKSGPVSEKLTVTMPNPKLPDGTYLKPALFTAPVAPERMGSYGKVLIFVDGADIALAGRMVMHYSIDFLIPQALELRDWVPTSNIEALTIKTATASGVTPTEYLTTTGPELLFTKGGTAHYNGVDQIVSGIINDLTTATLTNIGGQALRPGTRVFLKSSNVDDTSLLDESEQVGGFNLSNTFSDFTKVFFTGAVNTIIGLSKVYYL